MMIIANNKRQRTYDVAFLTALVAGLSLGWSTAIAGNVAISSALKK